jgi:deoxyribose-phosphate aldolase
VSSAEDALRVLPLIDLTSLGDSDTTDDIDALCRAGTTSAGSVAAVCVWPRFVRRAAEQLSETELGIAAVANFPYGHESPECAMGDARRIAAAGGTEVDVVIPWRSLAAGRAGVCRDLVAATRAALGDDLVLKAILETGELANPTLIHAAAVEALDGGADFLKTSTGKTPHLASLEAATILLISLRERDAPAGIKISGGIRSVEQATAYLDEADRIMGSDWVSPATFRFGASSLLNDVLSLIESN